jgi:hypothetical protein
LEDVEGLAPDRSKHDVYVNFEAVNSEMKIIKFSIKISISFSNQISGTPLSGRKRLQFSLWIEPIEQYEALSKLPEVLLPIVWIEEGNVSSAAIDN